MKNIFTILTIVALLTSCATDKYLLPKEEMVKFTVKGDSIFYNSIPVALYTHWEYELNPSHGKKAKPIVELSVRHFDIPPLTEDLIKFIHTLHPRTKIEVISPREFRNAIH